MNRLTAILAITVLCFFSCKKNTQKKTTCASDLYAYNRNPASTSLVAPSTFGKINTTTYALSGSAGTMMSGYANQGAFNTFDQCYYVFKHGEGSSILYKVSMTGILDSFIAPTSPGLQGLVYSESANKLYACTMDSSASSIQEITISGTSFFGITVATANSGHCWASPVTSAVDPASGDIYFALSSVIGSSSFHIEKFHPGSATTTIVAHDTCARIMGLTYNKNDQQIYAIKEDSIHQYIVKVNPVTGICTTLSTMASEANNELYSAAFDHCNNNYIVSTILDTTSCRMQKFNTSGALVQTDIVNGLLQGLTFH